MLYLTCTMISSVDLAHKGVSRAKHWISVDCGTRAFCTCSRCGWVLFGHFFSRLSFLFSFSISGRSSVDLAQYEVALAKDWVSVDCGTKFLINLYSLLYITLSRIEGVCAYFQGRQVAHFQFCVPLQCDQAT